MGPKNDLNFDRYKTTQSQNLTKIWSDLLKTKP